MESLPVAAVKRLFGVGKTVQYLAAQPGEGKQVAMSVSENVSDH